MSFSAHYLFAVLLTIFSLPTSLAAQSTPKTPRGSISGRVTLKEKGVFGVAVALRKFETTNAYDRIARAMTDQDGFYRLSNVAPGNYEVSPSVPAFVPAEMRESHGKTVLIGEDENVENINFALVRGGVITGRVTDADGRPVIQQQVFIYRAETLEQRRGQTIQPQIFASTTAATDDRGIYRVFGLMPGRYKVAAGRGENTFSGQISPGRLSYTQIFHPDADDQAKATVIEVGEGTEATNVDITLGRALQTFTVAGRVVDREKNLPVPNIRLVFQLQTRQRVEFATSVATSNDKGDFVKEGLIPGKYGILVFTNDSGGMLGEPVTVDIIDQDVSGVTVKLAPGASLSGVVVLEPENPAVLSKFAGELLLRGYIAGNPTGLRSVGGSTSPVAPNGSFLLTGLSAGQLSVLLSSKTGASPPKGFILSRIEREGEVFPRGIPIKEGEQLTGMRVVLNYGTAILRGTVGLENGTLPNGARILVSLTKPGERVSNMRPALVDARGHFLIEGIPAGTYEVRAIVNSVPQMLPPRLVKRDMNIQDGVTTEVILTIDMNPPQKP